MTLAEALQFLELMEDGLTETEVKRPKRRRVRESHPDINGEQAHERMCRLNEAADVVLSLVRNAGAEEAKREEERVLAGGERAAAEARRVSIMGPILRPISAAFLSICRHMRMAKATPT